MKKTIFMAAIAAIVGFTACQKESATGVQNENGNLITEFTAVYTGDNQTRVAITPGSGQAGVDAVSWKEGDKIVMVATDGSTFSGDKIIFVLAEGAGTKNATFVVESGAGLVSGTQYLAIHAGNIDNIAAPTSSNLALTMKTITDVASGNDNVADNLFMTTMVTAAAATTISFNENLMSILELPITSAQAYTVKAVTVKCGANLPFMREINVDASGNLTAAKGVNTVRVNLTDVPAVSTNPVVRIPIMWDAAFTSDMSYTITVIDSDDKTWTSTVTQKALVAGTTMVSGDIAAGATVTPTVALATSIVINTGPLNNGRTTPIKNYTLFQNETFELGIANSNNANIQYRRAAMILPHNGTTASTASAVYSSSNTAVATVSSTGLVTAVSPGNAIITAMVNDGSGLFTDFNVTVTQPFSAFDRTGWGSSNVTLINNTPTSATESVVDATANPTGVISALFDGSTTTCLVLAKPGKNFGNVDNTGVTETGFIIDLGTPMTFNSFLWVSRIANAASGLRMAGCQIFASDDNSTWTNVTERNDLFFPWVNVQHRHCVVLPQTTARYFKLVLQNSGGIADWDPVNGSSMQISEFYIGNI